MIMKWNYNGRMQKKKNNYEVKNFKRYDDLFK